MYLRNLTSEILYIDVLGITLFAYESIRIPNNVYRFNVFEAVDNYVKSNKISIVNDNNVVIETQQRFVFIDTDTVLDKHNAIYIIRKPNIKLYLPQILPLDYRFTIYNYHCASYTIYSNSLAKNQQLVIEDVYSTTSNYSEKALISVFQQTYKLTYVCTEFDKTLRLLSNIPILGKNFIELYLDDNQYPISIQCNEKHIEKNEIINSGYLLTSLKTKNTIITSKYHNNNPYSLMLNKKGAAVLEGHEIFTLFKSSYREIQCQWELDFMPFEKDLVSTRNRTYLIYQSSGGMRIQFNATHFYITMVKNHVITLTNALTANVWYNLKILLNNNTLSVLINDYLFYELIIKPSDLIINSKDVYIGSTSNMRGKVYGCIDNIRYGVWTC